MSPTPTAREPDTCHSLGPWRILEKFAINQLCCRIQNGPNDARDGHMSSRAAGPTRFNEAVTRPKQGSVKTTTPDTTPLLTTQATLRTRRSRGSSRVVGRRRDGTRMRPRGPARSCELVPRTRASSEPRCRNGINAAKADSMLKGTHILTQ